MRESVIGIYRSVANANSSLLLRADGTSKRGGRGRGRGGGRGGAAGAVKPATTRKRKAPTKKEKEMGAAERDKLAAAGQ